MKKTTQCLLLRARVCLAPSTSVRNAHAFTRKVRGILTHLCPSAGVEFVRESLMVLITGVCVDDLVVVKAATLGVAEGMNLSLRETDFDLDS